MENCPVENCAPLEEESNLNRSVVKLPKHFRWNLHMLGSEIMIFQVTLQMDFAMAWTGNKDFPGCLIANDGRNKVYFNLSPTPSTTANKPAYGAICIKNTTVGEFLLKPFRYDSISFISSNRSSCSHGAPQYIHKGNFLRI